MLENFSMTNLVFIALVVSIIDQPVSTRLAFAFPYSSIDEGKFADETRAELADVLHVPKERFDVVRSPSSAVFHF